MKAIHRLESALFLEFTYQLGYLNRRQPNFENTPKVPRIHFPTLKKLTVNYLKMGYYTEEGIFEMTSLT